MVDCVVLPLSPLIAGRLSVCLRGMCFPSLLSGCSADFLFPILCFVLLALVCQGVCFFWVFPLAVRVLVAMDCESSSRKRARRRPVRADSSSSSGCDAGSGGAFSRSVKRSGTWFGLDLCCCGCVCCVDSVRVLIRIIIYPKGEQFLGSSFLHDVAQRLAIDFVPACQPLPRRYRRL